MRKRPSKYRDQIIALAEQGVSRAEIARRLGCSRPMVTIVLGAAQRQCRNGRFNIEIRTEAERHAIFARSPAVRKFTWETET